MSRGIYNEVQGWWWNYVLVPTFSLLCRGNKLRIVSPSGLTTMHCCEGWCGMWAIDSHDLHLRGKGGADGFVDGMRTAADALAVMGATTAQQELANLVQHVEEGE